MHLDTAQPQTLAGLAAAAGFVEGEAAGGKAADLGFGHVGVELAHQVEDAHDGGGRRARRVADGGLVDIDDLVDVVNALDLVVLADGAAGVVQFIRECVEEHFFDQ